MASPATTKKIVRKRKKHSFLAWMPAVIALSLSIATAAGLSLIGSAAAVSATDTNTVTANLGGAVSIDASTNCPAGAVGFGAVSSSTTYTRAGGDLSADCQVDYTSNTGAAGTLTVHHTQGGGNPAMCHDTNGCGVAADEVADKTNGAVAFADDEFGMAVHAAGGTNNGLDGAITANATGADGSQYYQIPDSGSPLNICDISGVTTDATCTVSFGLRMKAAQSAGGYSAPLTFTVTA